MIRLLFSCFFILPVFTLFAQTIGETGVTGNRDFSDGLYKEWIDIPEGSRVFPGISDTITARISKELKSRSYFHFTINKIDTIFSSDSTRLDFIADVNESKPTYLTKFNFTGLTESDSVIVTDRLEFLIGYPFQPQLLESELHEIISEYEIKGYPFTNFRVNNINFEEKEDRYEAELYITFDKEEKSTIDKIIVTGNTKTNEDVIIRELRLNSGEMYNQEKIDEIPATLNRLRFFQPVNSPVYYFDDENNGVLEINVVEKETNNFDGIVGYVPARNDDEDGYFTGYVNISLRNLFGTGRALGILWDKQQQLSQELQVKYLEPWIFSLPVNISGEVYQRKQDSTFINQRYTLGVEYLASETITAGFNISSESTIPSDSESELFTVYNSSSITTEFTFTLNTTDDFYAPTRGIIFNNAYGFSNKKINGPDQFIYPETQTEINLQRIELDFHFFLELFRRQVLALKLNGRELRGDFFEVSDLYELGGTNTLRGYRERQFLGNRTFWSNLEYRYLLTRRTYAFAFFDTGYFLRNEDIDRGVLRQSDFKTGFGFGINLETGLGVLGVSYALGEGDSFSNGKLHFGILNEF